MNSRAGRTAPCLKGLASISCLLMGLCACSGMRAADTRGEPVVASAAVSPERAVAIAEMRAQAEAGDNMAFPDPFQAEQTRRLALRGEPRTTEDVQAIQAELSLIAARRSAATNPQEIARLDARAKELRRLALAAGASAPRP
jgi:hypothetical protein